MAFEVDDDLPGLGQFYCLECARHFDSNDTLDKHKLSKLHKRRWDYCYHDIDIITNLIFLRLKDVAQPQYSQEEADKAAGMGKQILPTLRHHTWYIRNNI